jgi:hypothetical protein
MKPSELAHAYADLDPNAVQAYLLTHGWVEISRDERGIVAFRNPHPPIWSSNLPSSTLFVLPDDFETKYNLDYDSIVIIPPKRFRDYPQRIAETIADIERHEDRWRGAIIDDIQNLWPVAKMLIDEIK